MAVLNPDHLLDQARRLITAPAAGRPRQVDLRRAISSAYYAVFHAIVTAEADELVGQIQRGSRDHGIVMRSIDHREIATLCEEIGKLPSPQRRYAAPLARAAPGPQIEALAAVFPDLQDQRHSADYDSLENYVTSDAANAIALADAALAAFRTAPPPERRAFVFLLLFPPRR